MTASTESALPTTGTLRIDPIHSSVLFRVRHHGIAAFRASFDGVSGAYDGDTGVLSGSVEVANIHLPIEPFKKHMLDERWFHAERYPTLDFRSTRIEVAPDGSLTVDGELTIRGVTRPVTATGTLHGPLEVLETSGERTERASIELRATIDRRDYGISANSEAAAGLVNISWEVELDVTLDLVREA